MGYTHYWTMDSHPGKKAYAKALTDCRKIIKASPVLLGNSYGEGKPSLINGVFFNGVGGNSHETFALGKEPRSGSDFCKTACKPYDLIVVACLCVLHDRGVATVASDGEGGDWEDGREFAMQVLGRSLVNPIDGHW